MESHNDEDPESKLPLHEDIMQLARLGELGPIQKLLDEGKYTADYKDAENITPLHVRSLQGLVEIELLIYYSGLPSTIISLSAVSCSNKEQMSTRWAASIKPPQHIGLYKSATTTSSIYFWSKVPTQTSPTPMGTS